MLGPAVDVEVLARLRFTPTSTASRANASMRSFCVVIIRGTIVTLRIALLVALLVAPSARARRASSRSATSGSVGSASGRRRRSSVRGAQSLAAARHARRQRLHARPVVRVVLDRELRLARRRRGRRGRRAREPRRAGGAAATSSLLRMPGPYYVRRVGEVELIVLDSTAISGAQTAWLRRTLATRTGFTRIVVPSSAVHLRRHRAASPSGARGCRSSHGPASVSY